MVPVTDHWHAARARPIDPGREVRAEHNLKFELPVPKLPVRGGLQLAVLRTAIRWAST